MPFIFLTVIVDPVTLAGQHYGCAREWSIPTEIIQQDCSSAVAKRGRGRLRKNASPLALQQKRCCVHG